ncbi:BTAD domain-containing putative transcriptional regulator [Saccharothrix violaceirubra]|uniref:DNA-binding SARP family transcriptional activator/tetratricopeptide (TPR) repeat protein n=1 Tax=Saccharothrix violaceirubra TaxID=413306 RepID=A0A7W7T2I3_9PSEU|nr:BTAD domain-containing putative transcriptional regulator [Saccharothrix violaceirubra]MBB4965316.1 DNA-binding SARP family transcriptional activator/tetratricopeptide (TPR) repeat protein [Saccharothrix violaceirubra]
MGELRVLGAVEAWTGSGRVDLGHPRQRCVLAALVVDANQVVGADRLLDRVWGERIPQRWRETLHSYLSRLRRALDGFAHTSIARRSGGWELVVPPDTVDLHRFRRLVARGRDAADPATGVAAVEEAMALWRGEPFTGLDTDWIDSMRASLLQERWAAELERTDLALRVGRHAEILPGLAVRVREHPLDERLAAQYLVALYRNGRQADALAHYGAMRERLADELGADPGPDLRAVHRRILTADVTLTVGALSRRPVPRQLPPPPPHFVGRADESGVLTGTEAGLFALVGAGGIGKTSLALHWAHRHADRFPDGHLFVDLRGFSPAGEPLAARDALRGFVTALGVVDHDADDLDGLAALFRSLVADRRILVVLDNAATSDQVVPLLPGTGTCTVLITGRRELGSLVDRYGVRHLRLDVLSRDEARSALTGRLGRARVDAEPEPADDLIGLCGGHPLALSIVARRASTHPAIPLAEFADELRDLGLEVLDDEDPAASLPTVLSWSLRGLSAEQRAVFGWMGTAPGPDIGLPAAVALSGLSRAATRAALGSLVSASLLERRPGGRFAMHDLVRDYAATVDPESAEPALRRVVGYYLHTAHAADRLLDPHAEPIRLTPPESGVRPLPLPDHTSAMAWFDAEHADLLAAQRTAVAHGWHDIVWQLAWTLTTFHTRRGYRHDELAVWQAAVDAVAHASDPVAGVVAHRVLGTAYGRLGRYVEATSHLYEALSLAGDDLTQQALTHRHLPWIWERRGDLRRALEHARLALDLHRGLDRPVGEARALNSAGWYAAKAGDYDTADRHCRESLVLHREHGNPTGEANASDSLGYIAQQTGRHDEAVGYYTRAVDLFRALGYLYEVANTLDSLGHPYLALGRTDDARAVWQDASELYRSQRRDGDADRVRRQLEALDALRRPGRAASSEDD